MALEHNEGTTEGVQLGLRVIAYRDPDVLFHGAQ